MTDKSSGAGKSTGKNRTAIRVAIIGLLGTILGIVISAWLAALSARKDKAIEIGEQIIENVERFSPDKSVQDTIIKEVFRAMIKGRLDDLNKILDETKILSVSDSGDSTTSTGNGNSQSSTPRKKESTKAEKNFYAKVSTSKADFEHYSNFRSNNIFLLLDPQKEIKTCQIDWDDDEAFQKVELQKEPKGEYFYANHQYNNLGKTVRNIRIKIQFVDGSRGSTVLTIFTYL